MWPINDGDLQVAGLSGSGGPLWYVPGAGGMFYGFTTAMAGLGLERSAILPGLGMMALGIVEAGGIVAAPCVRCGTERSSSRTRSSRVLDQVTWAAPR